MCTRVHGRVEATGGIERRDGPRGPGNLANTRHWMRGGTSGWQAAEAGAIGICWTNTLPNLPPRGATQPAIGNNALVIAVPRHAGHVVLDMAMSQFSFGALASYRARGEALPVAGGFDDHGQLTRDAVAIEASRRPVDPSIWEFVLRI